MRLARGVEFRSLDIICGIDARMAPVLRSATLVVLAIAATAFPSLAQTGSLSGFITDSENGEPLELVNVVLRSDDGNIRGAVSNSAGLYVVSGIRPGRYFVKASFIGYRPFTDTLRYIGGENRHLNFMLQPEAGTLDEVVVESERVGGAANLTAGQQTVRPADIELVPAPDLSADLAGLITTLPGVVALGDRGGQLFIRGGEPTQNLVQIDGVMVYQPFHIVGFYSAFPADLLTRTDIYAGGFGGRFGERISSVIDVSTRVGNNRRFEGAVTVSPFISAVLLEGPIVPRRWSLLFSARRSLVDGGASEIIGRELPFSFGDVFGKISDNAGSSGRLSAFVLRTHDRGTIAEDRGGAPPQEVRWTNLAAGVRAVAIPRITPVMVDARASYSQLPTELGSVANPERTSRIENVNVAVDATFFGVDTDVDAGASLRIIRIQNTLGGIYQNIDSTNQSIKHVGAYVEPEFKIGRNVRLRAGIRAQFFDIRFAPFLEPRLRLIWQAGAHQVSASAGIYHQAEVGLSDRRDAASVFTAWTSAPRPVSGLSDVRAGRAPRALHAILGYRATAVRSLELSVEGFYKRLTNLFIAEWTAFPRFTTNLQPATGSSFGADVRAELRTRRLYAYITYGLSSTRYKAEQAALILWYGSETLDFRPPHDRRHQVNALTSTNVQGFDISLRWEFGSGLPFSRAIGFDGFSLINDIAPAHEFPGFRRVIYERPFRGLLPSYHRMDFSVSRSFNTRQARFTVQASLINLYDRSNVFYLDVFTLRRVDQLPLIPSLSLKVELGQ